MILDTFILFIHHNYSFITMNSIQAYTAFYVLDVLVLMLLCDCQEVLLKKVTDTKLHSCAKFQRQAACRQLRAEKLHLHPSTNN